MSDSGRAAGSEGNNNEQKPNKPQFQFTPNPQNDFRKLKLSPNAAEGKERLSLKDLGTIVAQKTPDDKHKSNPHNQQNRRKKFQNNKSN